MKNKISYDVSRPVDIALADLNNDGIDEIVVANFATEGGATWTNSFIFSVSDGKIIETTIEHPFRTVNGKWASIDPLSTYQSRNGTTYRSPANAKLKEGLLLHGAEEHARVIKIVETGRKETVYHLAHVGMHNFFVEGFCVHNIIDQEIK